MKHTKWKRCGRGAALAVVLMAGADAVWSQPTQATQADSGWASPFNGVDFTGFYIFVKGNAPQVKPLAGQTLYNVDSGMIHAPNGPNAHLITERDYSWYRVRVDYRYSPAAGSENAGLVLHIDKAQANSGTLTANDNRPRSIEVNMRRAESSPWTLWSGVGLGPYITTTVQSGTQNGSFPSYLPAASGGVAWTCDPWGSRVIYSALPNTEKPMGQWNHGEARMFGDSGIFHLNGQLRCEGWNFQTRVNPANPTPRVAYNKGGIGLQSEGHEIWYRNFEVMELDSVTLLPVNARRGCTNRLAANYDARAVVDNGSCSTSGIRGAPGAALGKALPGSRRYNASGQRLKPRAALVQPSLRK